jgi:adenylate cyclase
MTRPEDDPPRPGSRPDTLGLEPIFRAEEIAGLRLATRARLIMLAVIAIWLPFGIEKHLVLPYEILAALFAAAGLLHYRLAGRGPRRRGLSYPFVALDFILLSVSLVWPAKLLHAGHEQVVLRGNGFVYLFLFVALVALSFSPRLMLWAGSACALAWSGAFLWVLSQPGTRTADLRSLPMDERIRAYLDPRFVDVRQWIGDILVLLIVTGVLTTVVWRSRRLVLRQAESARERANLARYFPPTIVDRLAQLDHPFASVRTQPVAVLFADVVGFTSLSEREAPQLVVEMLRDLHGRLERAVFEHGGTLDKFLGDGIMATFGTPDTGPRDAANALACARAMLEEVQDMNRRRAAAGLESVRLSIGVHYGEAVLGDIGSERRLEFAVLGDVVNVASRLEHATRELNCQVAVSGDVIQALRTQAGEQAESLLAGFAASEPVSLRGRDERVAVARFGRPGD